MKERKLKTLQINIWALSGAIGIRIALPVVLLTLLGIKIDHWLQTLPFFTITSLFVSFAISVFLIKRDLYDLALLEKSDKNGKDT